MKSKPLSPNKLCISSKRPDGEKETQQYSDLENCRSAVQATVNALMLDSPTHTPFRQMVEVASVGGRSEFVQKCWRPVKVSKCVESETMRLFWHVVARWGVDRSVFVKHDIVGVSPTQPVLVNLSGRLFWKSLNWKWRDDKKQEWQQHQRTTGSL